MKRKLELDESEVVAKRPCLRRNDTMMCSDIDVVNDAASEQVPTTWFFKLEKVLKAMESTERHALEQRVAAQLQTIEDGGHWIFGSGKNKMLHVRGVKYNVLHVIWLLGGNAAVDFSTHRLWRHCELKRCVRSEHHMLLTCPVRDDPFANATDNDFEHGVMTLTRHQVERPDGHLDWNGPVNKANGYGYVGWRGKNFTAHQLSYLLNVQRGPLPTGMVVAHGIGCPKTCSKAEHMRLSTYEENTLDRRYDGTMTSTGMTMPMAEEIRSLKGQLTQRERAKKFSVSLRIVRRVDQGKSWLTDDQLERKRQARAVLSIGDYHRAVDTLKERATSVPLTEEEMASEAYKAGALRGPHLIPSAAPNVSGYCYVSVKGTQYLAHRAAAISAAGEIPQPKTVARHTCVRKDCFAHVQLGTYRENSEDRLRGNGGGTKLTIDDVRAIRAARGCRAVEVAAKFNVTKATITRIWSGRSYRWVSE